MQAIVETLIEAQTSLSRSFDRCLPTDYVVDGNREYLEEFAPRYLYPGAVVWDVGGGKNPFVSRATKERLGLRVTGLDLSRAELDAAPTGIYDSTVCTDITSYQGGQGDADIVFCQAVLEHVADTAAALSAIERILKPGGRAVLFVPSRNAAYARLNLILPEAVKRAILFTVYPRMRRSHGFPAYYHRCTPTDFREMSRGLGLTVEELRTYHCSSYFNCFFPVHFIWRLWLMAFRWFAGEQAAETFSITLRKPVPAA
jgi:2-polyprenyl-3-methyl-5-hydroxy-6-metoxy-1,4-benzoquinol methylase